MADYSHKYNSSTFLLIEKLPKDQADMNSARSIGRRLGKSCWFFLTLYSSLLCHHVYLSPFFEILHSFLA